MATKMRKELADSNQQSEAEAEYRVRMAIASKRLEQSLKYVLFHDLLQCTALHCTAVYIEVYCTVVYCSALCCSVVYC